MMDQISTRCVVCDEPMPVVDWPSGGAFNIQDGLTDNVLHLIRLENRRHIVNHLMAEHDGTAPKEPCASCGKTYSGYVLFHGKRYCHYVSDRPSCYEIAKSSRDHFQIKQLSTLYGDQSWW
jgi:hypothetical protein